MDDFNSLLDTLNRLLAPNGCPWNREQTMQSLRHTLVEETFEVIEAIDLNDNQSMEEELGDLLFNIVFLCKLAEKEERQSALDGIPKDLPALAQA